MAAILIALVCLSSLRRFALVLASLLPPRPAPPERDCPTVQVLVAAHNEEANLPGLLNCLAQLHYPAGKLSFIFLNDGSRDATAAILNAWCAGRENALAVHNESNAGKAAALQLGLNSAKDAELTALYDADVRPRPESLQLLAAEFSNAAVGAAGGPVLPSNADSTIVSRYAALELYTFHLVIQTARQRLGWNPPVIGANCMYRTSALRQIGGFPQSALSEDVETSFALVGRGWRTSYLTSAMVTTSVPTTLKGFWQQRQRWTKGLYQAGLRAPDWSSVLVAAGYADRLILLAASLASLLGKLSFFWPLLYFIGPGLAICIALWRSAERGWVRFMVACLPMFLIDVISTVVGTVAGLRPAKSTWDRA